jgi:hypothetical protein
MKFKCIYKQFIHAYSLKLLLTNVTQCLRRRTVTSDSEACSLLSDNPHISLYVYILDPILYITYKVYVV